MSLSFWVNLVLALMVFAGALLFINRSKFRFVQRLRAARLRDKIVPKMQAILPMVVAPLPIEAADLFPLFRLKADLEALSSRASVLYEVEQHTLANFLAKLSTHIARVEAGVTEDALFKKNVEDLVLSGQRVIIEVTELA